MGTDGKRYETGALPAQDTLAVAARTQSGGLNVKDTSIDTWTGLRHTPIGSGNGGWTR